MINFEIATPEKVVYKDTVAQITLPTQLGEITILPNHLPLLAAVRPGVIRLIKDGAEKFLTVGEGFLQVNKGNRVLLLAENSETAEELDLERAERAKQRAQELMKQKSLQDVDYVGLAVKMERELARLKVARRHVKGRASSPESQA